MHKYYFLSWAFNSDLYADSLLFSLFFLLHLNKKQNSIKPLKHNFTKVGVYFPFKATRNRS